MRVLNKGLQNKCNVDFLVPIPFKPKTSTFYSNNYSDFVDPNVFSFTYFSVPRRKLPFVTKSSLAISIKKFLSDKSYDIIHIHWSYPECLIFDVIKKLNSNAKIVYTLHGHMFYDVYQNSSLKPYFKNAISKSDAIICVGERLKSDFAKIFIDQNKIIHHIPNGIDPESFRINEIKSNINSTQPCRILTVSNVFHEKGTDLLVKAFISSDLPDDTELHIVGRIDDHTYFENIESYIKQSRTKKPIHFHGGVSHSEVIDYYQSATFFVLPSRVEGFGVALVEAGMCGLPLISTNSGGPQQIINSENGILCSTNSVPQLQESIERMYKTYQTYNPEEIRNSMIQRYSLEKSTESLLSLYKKILY